MQFWEPSPAARTLAAYRLYVRPAALGRSRDFVHAVVRAILAWVLERYALSRGARADRQAWLDLAFRAADRRRRHRPDFTFPRPMCSGRHLERSQGPK